MTGAECGDEHQRAADVSESRRVVQGGALHAVATQLVAGVAEDRAQCRTLLMMIGRIALSSKLPWAAGDGDGESSPITWMQTMTIASYWVGLTLPGMIDEPGSLAGSMSSCIPERGPEASQRMSLAIFISATASSAQAGGRRDHPVERALRGELVRRGPNGIPVSCAMLCRDLAAEPGRGVEAGADGGPADCQLVDRLERARAVPRHLAAGRLA